MSPIRINTRWRSDTSKERERNWEVVGTAKWMCAQLANAVPLLTIATNEGNSTALRFEPVSARLVVAILTYLSTHSDLMSSCGIKTLSFITTATFRVCLQLINWSILKLVSPLNRKSLDLIATRSSRCIGFHLCHSLRIRFNFFPSSLSLFGRNVCMSLLTSFM